MFSDKTAALDITDKQGIDYRTRTIEDKYNHVKNLIFGGVMNLEHVTTLDQIADILTKPVISQII